MQPPRRVVAGLDGEGRSCILIDGPSEMVIWATDDIPADNGGVEDAGGRPFDFPTSGTRFVYSDFAPGRTGTMHATDTLDYLVVISGEVSFITETGAVLLRAGDVVVDRGILHAWRNDGEVPCRIVNVLCPAHPVGAGATVRGTVGQD